jgi:non-heme chloroperoxidase
MSKRRALFLSTAILFIFAPWALCRPNDTGSISGTSSAMEGKVTTRSGITIHYLQSGASGDSRALVLIPGWRLPAYLWTGQLHEFAQTMRVIAIDPRSQGPSTKTREGNSPEARAEDLHEVMAALGISRPVLVGWSQGAQDVAAYLQQYGSASLAGIALVDSPVSIGPGEVKAHPEFAQAILSGVAAYMRDPQAHSRDSVRSLFKQPHPDLDFEEIVKATLQTPVDTGAAMLIADIFGADRMSALAKLDKPALVIAASSSPLLVQQKEMAAKIPGAKFLAIDGAGHAVFVDQPKQFNDALKGFLAALDH